jgi:hypothetical protein
MRTYKKLGKSNMKYIILNGIIKEFATLPDASLYNFSELTPEQIAFYLANPTASVSEVLAMELEPIPEPPEPSNEPTIEERQEAIEEH